MNQRTYIHEYLQALYRCTNRPEVAHSPFPVGLRDKVHDQCANLLMAMSVKATARAHDAELPWINVLVDMVVFTFAPENVQLSKLEIPDVEAHPEALAHAKSWYSGGEYVELPKGPRLDRLRTALSGLERWLEACKEKPSDAVMNTFIEVLVRYAYPLVTDHVAAIALGEATLALTAYTYEGRLNKHKWDQRVPEGLRSDLMSVIQKHLSPTFWKEGMKAIKKEIKQWK